MSTTSTVPAEFATRLYNALAKSLVGKDLFLSPFSIQTALAMCAAGARGETRRVMAELIGAPESIAAQNREYAAMIASVNNAGGGHVELTTANALWVQQGEPLLPEYQKAVLDYYGGACSELDFRGLPDAAVAAINGWVKIRTAGKIKDLIQRELITADTRLILTNAIHFKGKWADEFDKSHTWDEDWHGAGGAQKAALMHKRGAYRYFERADFQALDIPYKGDELSLLVVLPKKANGLAALESRWSGENLYQQVTGSLTYEEVILSLPRFKLETTLQLKPILFKMGAALAFSDNADFTGISATPLKISEVVHKAFVDVNEEGTEAAAATGVLMAKCAAVAVEPKSFVADHPFLFMIRQTKTNQVLFSGRVLDPKT